MADLTPWLWLGGSFLLAIAVTQGSWQLWHWGQGRERLAPFVQSAFFPFVLHTARLLYYLGLPFAALLWGHDAVVRSLLGLQTFSPGDPLDWADWARDVGWAAALGAAAWLLLALGWLALRRSWKNVPAGAHTPAWALLRDAALHEAHWVFYRNAPILALQGLTDRAVEWGAWGGFALIALEATLNPWWLVELQSLARRSAALLRIGLALLSTVLYVQTRNLWLAVLVHWGVTWGIAAWVRRFSPTAGAAAPRPESA